MEDGRASAAPADARDDPDGDAAPCAGRSRRVERGREEAPARTALVPACAGRGAGPSGTEHRHAAHGARTRAVRPRGHGGVPRELEGEERANVRAQRVQSDRAVPGAERRPADLADVAGPALAPNLLVLREAG